MNHNSVLQLFSFFKGRKNCRKEMCKVELSLGVGWHINWGLARDQGSWGLPGGPEPIPPPRPGAGQPGDSGGSPIPRHHCGRVWKAWGEEAPRPTMRTPWGLQGPLQPVGAVDPRPLRMQAWPWLVYLPALVLAHFGSQDDISTAFNFNADSAFQLHC